MSVRLRQKLQGVFCHSSTLKTSASIYLNSEHSKCKYYKKQEGISKSTGIHISKLYKSFFFPPLKRYTKQVYASISLFILTAGKNRKASATLSHLIHLLLCKTLLVRDAWHWNSQFVEPEQLIYQKRNYANTLCSNTCSQHLSLVSKEVQEIDKSNTRFTFKAIHENTNAQSFHFYLILHNLH